MRIGTREIGEGHAPYVIAELGVNHDGSVERALELTRLAAEAGADAVKLQLFRADLLMSRASVLAAYQRDAGEHDPRAMLRRLELSVDQMEPVVRLAHTLGVHAIVTVFSLELAGEAERLPWDAYKTASPDIINKPLLDALAATGRPLVVSTGASTLREVGRALGWLRPARERLAVMQCVSSYPTPLESAEFGGVRAIRDIFDGPVGYSDHTPHVQTGGLAMLTGARLFEKHFTYSRAAPGPDHAASLERDGLRRYIDAVRRIEARLLRGDFAALARDCAELSPQWVELLLEPDWRDRASPLEAVKREKRVLPIEEDVRRVSRQSLVTTRALPAGHALARADLTVKRPGTGIPPHELERTVGRVMARAVEADTPLVEDDLAAGTTHPGA